MIEEIVNGIWEDVSKWAGLCLDDLSDEIQDEIKRRWRIIIRKAIAESSCSQMELDCSQAMLEETAVMDR